MRRRGLRRNSTRFAADGRRGCSLERIVPEPSTDALHRAAGTAVVRKAEATRYVGDCSVTVELQ